MLEIAWNPALSRESSVGRMSIDKHLVLEKFNQAISGDLDSFLLQNFFASDNDSLSAAILGKVSEDNTIRLISEMISFKMLSKKELF